MPMPFLRRALSKRAGVTQRLVLPNENEFIVGSELEGFTDFNVFLVERVKPGFNFPGVAVSFTGLLKCHFSIVW